MIRIEKASPDDHQLIAELGRITFIESHGSSASADDIAAYVAAKYTPEAVKTDIANQDHLYYIVYYGDQAAGYSKIILNCGHPEINQNPVAKLDRIYILREYYDKKIGLELLQFNVDFVKQARQVGIWLYVWTENQRAVKFYLRNGFTVIGSHDFPISATHSNPNYRLYLDCSL
jgi:ribosomal protein S18 acetylase RimI-like enzyme